MVVHFVEHDRPGLAQRLDEVFGAGWRCAPRANARTKALLLKSLDQTLEAAAGSLPLFAEPVIRVEEGIEGTRAFCREAQGQVVFFDLENANPL